MWIEATIAPSSTSYLQLLWFPCDETDFFRSFPYCWGDVGCSIVVHFALVPLTFTNESTKLAMSMYTYQQTLQTYISWKIYNIHTIYRNQPLLYISSSKIIIVHQPVLSFWSSTGKILPQKKNTTSPWSSGAQRIQNAIDPQLRKASPGA